MPEKNQETRNKDAGMAFTLICILAGLFTKKTFFYVPAAAAAVITMVVPACFGPFGILWYKLSEILGAVVSRIFLSLVFFLVVTPIGFLMRLAGKDGMKLRQFKTGEDSAFQTRDYVYTDQDLTRPY